MIRDKNALPVWNKANNHHIVLSLVKSVARMAETQNVLCSPVNYDNASDIVKDSLELFNPGYIFVSNHDTRPMSLHLLIF